MIENKKPILIAHRGNSIHAPENTLAAFRLAVEQNVSFIECDIHLTKDGIPVVIHDRHLRRTSDHPEDQMIDALTLEEVKRLDCGRWFHESFSGEKILTLQELLSAPLKNIGVMIEVKEGSAPNEKLVAAVLKDVSDYKLKHPKRAIVVGSQSTHIVKLLKRMQPDLHTIGIARREKDFIEYLDQHCDFIAAYKGIVDEELVRRSHANGKPIWVWTVAGKQEILHCLKCGVDGIISDDPKYVESQMTREVKDV